MYAGVPGKEAVDAWYEVLTKTETMKLDGKEHCGGVADIAKFFDKIRRPLIYKLAEAAGMPPKVLRAYNGYLKTLNHYNALAGGIGKPYRKKCGIPQGVPVLNGDGRPHYAAVDCRDEDHTWSRVLHPGR